MIRFLARCVAVVLVVWIFSSLWAQCAKGQPDELEHFAPPDSTIPDVYRAYSRSLDYPWTSLGPEQLKEWGIVITLDDRTPEQLAQRSLIPLAMLDDSIEPFPPGWPFDTFGVGGYNPPEGMPDLYYQCVAWIEAGDWEGHLEEELADGAWHYDSQHLPDMITWDCCPDSLWPHPAGCVRILGRWYQDPDTGGWSHWQWQVRWNRAIVGYWEIVGGLPGGGWWSPHWGPTIQADYEREFPRQGGLERDVWTPDRGVVQLVAACMACCGYGLRERAFTNGPGAFAPWAMDSIWRNPDQWEVSTRYAVLCQDGLKRWGVEEWIDTLDVQRKIAREPWTPSDSNRVYDPDNY